MILLLLSHCQKLQFWFLFTCAFSFRYVSTANGHSHQIFFFFTSDKNHHYLLIKAGFFSLLLAKSPYLALITLDFFLHRYQKSLLLAQCRQNAALLHHQQMILQILIPLLDFLDLSIMRTLSTDLHLGKSCKCLSLCQIMEKKLFYHLCLQLCQNPQTS